MEVNPTEVCFLLKIPADCERIGMVHLTQCWLWRVWLCGSDQSSNINQNKVDFLSRVNKMKTIHFWMDVEIHLQICWNAAKKNSQLWLTLYWSSLISSTAEYIISEAAFNKKHSVSTSCSPWCFVVPSICLDREMKQTGGTETLKVGKCWGAWPKNDNQRVTKLPAMFNVLPKCLLTSQQTNADLFRQNVNVSNK